MGDVTRSNLKLVQFQEYCTKCKNKKTPETEDPCNECLTYPARENTRKPLKFEEE
jgi:hypothetical protein